MNVTRKILPILLLASMILTSGVVDSKRFTRRTNTKNTVEYSTKKDKTEKEPCRPCREDNAVSKLGPVKSRGNSEIQDLRKYYKSSDDERNLCFAGYVFDPTDGLNVDKGLLNEFHSGENYAIIQMKGAILRSWRDEIENRGVEIYGYIPHNSYLVKIDSKYIDKIKNLSSVRAVIPYHPALKLQPTIGKHELVGADDRPEVGYRLMITLFPDADELELERKIGDLSIRIVDKSYEYKKRIIVDVNKGTERDIARIEGVKWIEERGEYFTHNYRHRGVVQTGALRNEKIYNKGIYGSNQIICMMDSGLDETLSWFSGKVLSYTAYGGGDTDYCDETCFGGGHAYSHGTHTTGTAAGYPNSKWDGVAYGADIIFQDIGATNMNDCCYGYLSPPSDLHSAFINARSSGAYVHSNSWGGGTNEYESYCVDVDDYMWNNQDFLVVSSSGNTSGGASSGSISYFATAKNLISVGSVGMPMDDNYEPNDSFDYRCAYSNYGPIYDGRTGPTVVNVAGVGSSSWNSDSTYTWSAAGGYPGSILGMSGTSMACPGVAGAALLVREYYGDGFYPSGSANSSDSIKPSAALVKATIVAGSDHLGNPVDDERGFGRIHLDTALYFNGEPTKMQVRDCSSGLETGADSSYWRGVYSTSLPLTVVLVWTDYPASSGANPALVNDLDLEVISPGGDSYKGNYFSGGWSQPNAGSYDDLNPVEMVYIEPGTYSTGDWNIVIHGTSIPNGPQPFAFVMTGDVGTSGNQPPNTPSLVRIFDNAIYNAWYSGVSTYECTLSVKTTDLEGDDIDYQIRWDTDPNFGSPETKDIGSYASGTEVETTIPLDSTDPETLYFWEVRATDPLGSGNWSTWSERRSFIMDMELGDASPYWYQWDSEQFSQCTYSNVALEGDSVVLGEPPTLVDTINLSSLSVGCWGITYDYDRDVLWVGEFGDGQDWCYAIQKTSPCTKVDSFQFGTGSPTYHLGLGYAGSDIIYFATHTTAEVYYVDINTGNCTKERDAPGGWGNNQGLGFNEVDDAVYTGSWGSDQCAWAIPSGSGSWNTWSLTAPSGMSGAYDGSTAPEWLFVVDENSSGAKIYQHALTGGTPNTTPTNTYDCDPSQSQASTADCTFDGQYVYVLDQQDPDMVYVYDVSTPGGGDGVLYSPPIVFNDLWKEDHSRTSWVSASWTKAHSDDSVGLQFEYKNNGTWQLIGDLFLPGNSNGFFQMGNITPEKDLSGLDESTFDTIRMKALIRTEPVPPRANSSPALKMWALGGGSVTHVETSESPRVFALKRNKPNPFTGKTEIRYQIPEREKVELKIYDVMGRSVKTLMNKEQKPGFYAVSWRGTDKKNKKLPAGIYFLRMEAGDYLKTHKMLMLR